MDHHPARVCRRLALAVALLLAPLLLPVFGQVPLPVATPSAATGGAAANPAAATPILSVAENPYGVHAVWRQGDLVARGTLLVLVLMSLSSWYVIVIKVFEQARIGRQSKALDKDFWSGGSVLESAHRLSADSPFRFITEKALDGVQKHEGLRGAIDFNTWLTLSIQRAMASVQSQLQGGLAVLATVGSTAPFVGLFGTVWGIYNALISIGLSGQASIDKVAGPVGEALIMTAIGLAVAVPAVLGYNWLVRRNKAAMEQVQAFGEDLHAVMLATTGPGPAARLPA